MSSILIVLASTLLWPAIHIGVFMARFPENPVPYNETLGFILMGLIAGLFVANWYRKSSTRRHRVAILIGYVIASPVAFIGSLAGGLFLPPWLGATLFGGVPLIIGAWIGNALGRKAS